MKHEPARNDRGNDRDRKRTYDDRSAAVWTGGYNSFDAAQLSADRKNTRYDEPPYDRPSNRRNDREGPTRSPPTSRRRFEDAPSSSMVRLHRLLRMLDCYALPRTDFVFLYSCQLHCRLI